MVAVYGLQHMVYFLLHNPYQYNETAVFIE